MVKIKLDGFTRGFAFDDNYFYVGESANRKEENPPDYSHIAIIERMSFQVVDRIRVPFPEIYEIVPITDALAKVVEENRERFLLYMPS